MIKKISVKNFKSLFGVAISFEKFNCFIGMNGSGKSTVLQVLDFISQIMIGQVDDWLHGRAWDIHDLSCKLRKEGNIRLGVNYELIDGQQLVWFGSFNRGELRCTGETIYLNDKPIFFSKGTRFRIENRPFQEISFIYQGSLLSALKDSELPSSVLEFRDAMRHIRSLELLSPQLMRKSARTNDFGIGSGGEKLAGYLYGIKGKARDNLVNLLKVFYPYLVDYKVTNQRAGWKKLSVIEQYSGQKLETEATHISDGLLRVLAVLAQSDSDRSLILLDEIENGINQEIIEKLVDTLVASLQQIVVTTHSPLILNFLDDELASRAVQFIYKTPQGESRIRRFFEIPRIAEKLNYMGPGDAFVDTDLEALTEECIELDRSETDSVVDSQA